MSTIEYRVADYLQKKQELDIFDSSIFWHPRLTDAFVTYSDWQMQRAALKEAGIKGGLVTSDFAMRYDPYEGNSELAEICNKDDSFASCIVLTPDMIFDQQASDAYLKKMRSQGASAARLVPGTYRHSTQEYCIGDMLDALSQLGLPVILWHIDTGFDAIDRICSNHPELKVILDSMDRKLLYHARDYLSLLKKHSNFYMETHNLVLFNEYEEIYRLVGDQQMVFGSYSPYACPDFSIYPIIEADIPEEACKNILSGNAKRIFGIK